MTRPFAIAISLFLILPSVHADVGSEAQAHQPPKRKASVSDPKRQDPYKGGLRDGAEVATYEMGRTVDKSGNLVEAHREYRVTQSARWRLQLPFFHRPNQTIGPRSVYSPPNCRPVPDDQRVKDLVAELEKSKAELQAALNQVRERMAQDNPLQQQLAQSEQEKQALRERLRQILGVPAEGTTPSPSPAPALPLSPAAKAGEAAADANDPLASWTPGKK